MLEAVIYLWNTKGSINALEYWIVSYIILFMAVGPENELWTVCGDFNDGPKTTNNLIARREAMIRNSNHSLYLKPRHTKHLIQGMGALTLGVTKMLTIRIFTRRHGSDLTVFIDFNEYKFKKLSLNQKIIFIWCPYGSYLASSSAGGRGCGNFGWFVVISWRGDNLGLLVSVPASSPAMGRLLRDKSKLWGAISQQLLTNSLLIYKAVHFQLKDSASP